MNTTTKIKSFKSIFMLAIVFMLAATSVSAQKFAFVDTDYILQNIPEYTDAQAQIEDLSKEWQQEVEAKFSEVEKMYKEYQAEAVLLPEEMKQKKEDEIIAAEKEAKQMQRKYFGADGDLFKKREELIKPIQDRIFTTIEELATSRNLGIVFDKAGSVTMLYANIKYDISDDVLDELGYSFNTRRNK